jgi:hypothetical protein
LTRAGWWQVALGDVGHPRAKNAPDTWHFLNQQAWQFLQSQIISITFARGGSTTSIDPDPNGPADDPLVNYIGGQIVPGQNQNCPASAGPARYTD